MRGVLQQRPMQQPPLSLLGTHTNQVCLKEMDLPVDAYRRDQ